MTKVSVIISAYNIEDYICKCVNSIMSQSLQNFEIIIVDDGSNDNTYKVIKKLSQDNPKIKVISQKNGGVQKARETGYKSSQGEYIIYVDGDDWLEKEALEKLYNKASKENLDILYYKCFVATENEKIKCDDIKFNINNKNELLEATLRGNIQPGLCLKFIKRNFIEENNISLPIEVGYGEDLASTVKLALYKPKFGFIDEALYCYFKRSDSVTNKLTKKVFDIVQAMDLIEKYLIEFQYINKYKELFEFLKYRHLYMNRVIDVSYKCSFHKDFYNIWKEQRIKIENNKEYKEYINSQKFSKKVKCYLYNKKYIYGKIYSIIIETVK